MIGETWDLLEPIFASTLLRLCVEGFVDVVMGGPPCSTHSALRFIPLDYPGAPRPLRFRGKMAWGRPDLRPLEHKPLKEANQLIFTYMSMAEAVC